MRALAVSVLVIGSTLLLPRFAHAQSEGTFTTGGDTISRPPVRSRWFPVQGDLALGGLYGRGDDQHATGSAYLGFATMDAESRVAGFFGSGIEGTISDATAAYHWSAGFGTRMGMAFRWGDSLRTRVPDLYLYGRVMPFVGQGRERIPLPNGGVDYGADRLGGGVRAGVGFTAPGWTMLLWRGIDAGGVDVPADEYTFVACVTYLVLTLVNHAEFVVEWYGPDTRAVDARVGFRIGTGF